MRIALVVAIVVFLIVFGPLVTIWSLNTLFPVLSIPYTINTWMATIILGGATGMYGAKFK